MCYSDARIQTRARVVVALQEPGVISRAPTSFTPASNRSTIARLGIAPPKIEARRRGATSVSALQVSDAIGSWERDQVCQHGICLSCSSPLDNWSPTACSEIVTRTEKRNQKPKHSATFWANCSVYGK